MKKVAWFIFFVMWSMFTTRAEVLNLDKGFIAAQGTKHIEYYLSNDTVSSPQERYFQMRASTQSPFKRYLFFSTKSQKWMLFDVKNPQKTPIDILVEMGNFGVTQVDYYIFYEDRIIKDGVVATRGGLKTSSYYDRNIVIPLTAQPGKKYSFLIKIHTSAPIFDLPVIIWNKNSKFAISQGIELGRGMFYGELLFFIIMIGLVIFLIGGKLNYLFWLYLFLGGLLLLLKSGIPLEVFWPGRSYIDFIITNFNLYAYLIVTLRFLKEYLSDELQSRWTSWLLDILTFVGYTLLILYISFSLLNVILQDTLKIIQTIYVNVTNVVVIILLFWSLPKVKDKFMLIISILYYFLFSAYLFNPFIEFGFWTGQLIGHILFYTGGLLIGIILLTVTSLRMKTVIKRNQQVKFDLRNANKLYSHSLVEGQEKQRKKVAEELHDGIGAHLSAIKMKLSMLAKTVNNQDEKIHFDRVVENLDELTLQVREMSHELMPPTLNRYGLQAAIEDMVNKYQQKYPIKLLVKTNLKQNHIDSISETILYRLLHQLFETLVYGHTKKAEIKLIILPSISSATIRVVYSGGIPLNQNNTVEFEDLKALANLLQGKIEYFMSSIWDDEIGIEIPVQLIAEVKESSK